MIILWLILRNFVVQSWIMQLRFVEFSMNSMKNLNSVYFGLSLTQFLPNKLSTARCCRKRKFFPFSWKIYFNFFRFNSKILLMLHSIILSPNNQYSQLIQRQKHFLIGKKILWKIFFIISHELKKTFLVSWLTSSRPKCLAMHPIS